MEASWQYAYSSSRAGLISVQMEKAMNQQESGYQKASQMELPIMSHKGLAKRIVSGLKFSLMVFDMSIYVVSYIYVNAFVIQLRRDSLKWYHLLIVI